MDDRYTNLKKKLIFRSNNRGCKENDIILGRFADSINYMSEEEILMYERFLDLDDSLIFAMVVGREEPGEFGGIVSEIRKKNKEYTVEILSNVGFKDHCPKYLKKHNVEIGRINSAHGILGLIKITSYADDGDSIEGLPLFILDDSGSRKDIRIKIIRRINANTFVCKVREVVDRSQAELLRGKVLYTERINISKCNDGEYLVCDLIGICVHDRDGKHLGVVNYVYNFGAGDVIEVLFESGEIDMFPFNSDFFTDISDHCVILANIE